MSWTIVETFGGGRICRTFRGSLADARAYAARRAALGVECEVMP